MAKTAARAFYPLDLSADICILVNDNRSGFRRLFTQMLYLEIFLRAEATLKFGFAVEPDQNETLRRPIS
jgi:hypothetical protein